MFAQPQTIGTQLVETVRMYLDARAHSRLPSAAESAAWRDFFGACDPLLRRFIGKQGLTGSDLDDCVQNAWVRVLRHLPEFAYDPSRGAFCTWLYTLAHSAAMDHLRRKSRTRTLDFGEDNAFEPADTHDDLSDAIEESEGHVAVDSILSAARGHLSPEGYQLMCLRWVEGRSVQETADAMHISHKQVWYREHRLKKKLQLVLKPDFNGPRRLAA